MTTPSFESPPPPDWFRARVRTAAQVAEGFLFALLVRWLGERFGIDISGWDPEVRQLVDLLAVTLATVLWMWITKALEARLPWLSRIFILEGSPSYPGLPPANPKLR